MNKSLIILTVLAAGTLLAVAGCSRQDNAESASGSNAPGNTMQAAPQAQNANRGAAGPPGSNGLSNPAYVATLYPMNTSVTKGSTAGKSQIAIRGGKMIIRVSVVNAPPGIAHWQHIHGFVSGKEAQCASLAADANGDGIVDLLETKPVSGITMVPLNAKPAAMDVASSSYPKASSRGNYMYRVTVPLDELQNAFANKFDGKGLNLASRVIYVHGVPKATDLPASVQSLPAAPAHVTLPIACGEVNAVPQQFGGR